MTDSGPALEEFEQRGFFLHIPFADEESPTVLYIAHKDFASLQKLIENPDTSWENFRQELFSLLEHSGHEKDHELPEETTREIISLVDGQELPEEPDIDNPLDELDTGDES